MSKTMTPPQKSVRNAKTGKASAAPARLHPKVVQTLTKDVAATAGDKAAQAVVPQSAAPKSDIEGVPYLGETRRQALALAGIRTLEDLRGASVEQIGGVKGVGMVNAARVKEWLAAQAALPSLPVADPSALIQAEANQHVQDVFQKIGSASARLKETLPAKTRDKALDRQLDKLDTVASELAEGPDTLSAKQVQEAVKTLDKIAGLLETAAGSEKLTPKKQAVLIEELRARRKRLQKTLGD